MWKYYGVSALLFKGHEHTPDHKKVFETAIRIVSALAGGNDIEKFVDVGREILSAENVDVVSVMGTGISAMRTKYALVGGRVVRVKWEQSRQFAKWEYWLALNVAYTRAAGDVEKLFDKNFV